MKRRAHLLHFLALIASLFLGGCIFLTNQQLQSLRLFLKTSTTLAAGEMTEVYSSIYPTQLKLKGSFVKVFGHLDSPGGASLPDKVTLQVVSLDADTERVYHRFKLPLKVKNDGRYSGIRKWSQNIKPNTMQMFMVEPQGAAIPSGTKVSLCIEVVKKKNQASGDASCTPGGSTGGGNVVTVQVLDNQFEPKSVRIQPGDTVRWILQGTAVNHTTTAMDSQWDSGFIFTMQGATFERTFSAADNNKTFEYFCETHQSCCQMQGSVRVGEDAPAPRPGY